MPYEKVVEILGLGVIGLGFYLAYFAYKLLKSEQGRPRSRKSILKAINKYLRFALILCLIAFASEIIRVFWPSRAELKKSIVALQGNLKSYISQRDLCSFLEISFDENLDEAQFKLKIDELLKQAEELEQCKSHYAFNLFKIETKMPDYGNSIDTRISIRREERKEVYEIIQIILRGINYYRHTIDGNQQSTYEAVKEFQEAINERVGSVYFNPDNFGVFGNRTLEAIRTEYRLQGG